MLNQAVLVGRIARDFEIINSEDGSKKVIATVAITRSYKNKDGIYETDFVDINISNGIASNTLEFVKKGDLIGIKGRIQTEDRKIVIIAEKITFLSSKGKEEEGI